MNRTLSSGQSFSPRKFDNKNAINIDTTFNTTALTQAVITLSVKNGCESTFKTIHLLFDKYAIHRHISVT
jgi:hypothetical protein